MVDFISSSDYYSDFLGENTSYTVYELNETTKSLQTSTHVVKHNEPSFPGNYSNFLTKAPVI